MRENLEFYVKVTTNICYKITVRKKLIYSVNSGFNKQLVLKMVSVNIVVSNIANN